MVPWNFPILTTPLQFGSPAGKIIESQVLQWQKENKVTERKMMLRGGYARTQNALQLFPWWPVSSHVTYFQYGLRQISSTW